MDFHRPLLSAPALDQWQQSQRGQQYLALEQAALDRVLPGLFGRCIVQVGSWGAQRSQIDPAQMPLRLLLGTVSQAGADARIDTSALPMAKGQADAVLLPHSLEYAASPHRLLREADRLLSPRGHLIILGFNPVSLWGLRQTIGLRHPALPAGGRLLSLRRICDWLHLLDLEVIDLCRFGAGFPWTRSVARRDGWTLWRMPGLLHEGFMLVARKRTVPLTPMRDRWAQRQPGISAAGVRVSFEAAARRRDDGRWGEPERQS